MDKELPGLTWEDIRRNSRLRTKFREAFLSELESCNEILINPDEVTTEHILDTFERQGYWSGVKYNIFFTPELGFEYEERRLGK